jgi:hypothetical protein
MERVKLLKILAAFVLGLAAVLWFIKGVSDLFEKVPGGAFNIFISLAMGGLLLLSWKKALLGGIITTALAVILAIYFNLNLPNIYIAFIPMFLMCAPMVISGLLFIEADWATRKHA